MTNPATTPIPEFPLSDPLYYQSHGYPHDYWTRMRTDAPIARIESGPIPFWAVTRHADITTVGKSPDRFLNRPRLMIQAPEDDDFERPPTIIDMDPPMHGHYRRALSQRFTPRAIARLHQAVDDIAVDMVRDLIARGNDTTIDFVEAVAAPFPIAVIGWLLGVPESDWPQLFTWTNRMVGADDPEMHPEGVDGGEDGKNAVIELFGYFAELLKEKRRAPDEGLLTALSLAEVEGKPLDEMSALAYCLALVVAGNETTRNATSGGMLALLEHPDELHRLQRHPAGLEDGIEEILRWTSPLIHFARTAACDTTLGDVEIKEGDALALFYPSGNRDDEVFEDPFRFDVTRTPNPHLAFGVGEHFCLGAHLARLELREIFKHLLPRIESVELAAPVARLRSHFVGGIKHLPVRYRFANA